MRVLLIALLLMLAPARVKIAVSPQAVIADGTIRVTCTVPRDPTNRTLEIVIPNYYDSIRELDGESAPVTYQLYVQHVPCDTSEVQCIVGTETGTIFRATAPISVAGCGL